jgi:muconolactone D-isomerase
VVIDLWKCVGSRRVIAVANVDSLDTLDKILVDLPIMKEHGQHVQIDVTPLRRLEDFATDLKKRLESSSQTTSQGIALQIYEKPSNAGYIRAGT